MDNSTGPKLGRRLSIGPRQLLAVAWICIIAMLSFYSWQTARIGCDIRDDFWDYWQNNRFYDDSQNALLNGRRILREAQALEREDQQHQSPTPAAVATEATLARPGPGLFDSPNDLKTVWNRWRQLRPVYGHLFRGWVATYDNLIRYQPDGEYQLDYPPLRSLVMTLWAWKVQAQYPGLIDFPHGRTFFVNMQTHQRQVVSPDIIRPLVICNRVAEGISAIAMFFLVWIWAGRGDATDQRWGDRLLLIPPILLGVFMVLRPFTRFEFASADSAATVIDARVTSAGWWIFLLLRYLSVIALARFLPPSFRSIVCGVVAATLVWINPASMLDSVGWPQWDTWILPFFLSAAVLVSLDWWLTAGLVLAVGGMFKGQTFFIAPVLVLCPLFAGWVGRFMRIIAGLAAGVGLIASPWLVANSRCGAYITATVMATAIMCGISAYRRPVWRDIRRWSIDIKRRWRRRIPAATAAVPTIEPKEISWPIWIAILLAIITAASLSLLIWKQQDFPLRQCTVALTLAILIVPWFMPRKLIAPWIVLIFAASLWLGAFSLNGSFSWWEIGFKYGTKKFQKMQLGFESLSNLPSILEHRYGWSLHDPVGTLHLPLFNTPIDLDIQSALAFLFGLTLLLNTVAASVHLRRRDPKFLVTLIVPWLLFVTLLTQMAARYTIFPAILAAALVGVSLGASLLQLLCVVLSCTMLGMQMLRSDPRTAPVLYGIARVTYPDMGWLMMLLAAVFLVMGMTPSVRRNEEAMTKPESPNE